MIQPLGANIIIKKEEQERVTSAGIVIPESVKDTKKLCFGEVVAIGKDVSDLQVSDRIVFNEFDFDKITLEQENFLFGSADNVIGIL